LVIVVKVAEHFLFKAKAAYLFCPPGKLSVTVTMGIERAAPVKTQIHKRGGEDFGIRKKGGIGKTQGDVTLGEDFVNLIAEKTGVTELKNVAKARVEEFHKGQEPFPVESGPGRKLEKEGTAGRTQAP
jgi:hypothetical protein